jgi:hypothetical protein
MRHKPRNPREGETMDKKKFFWTGSKWIDKNLLWSGKGDDWQCKAGRIRGGHVIRANAYTTGFIYEKIAYDADGNLLGKRKTVKGAKALVERNYEKTKNK